MAAAGLTPAAAGSGCGGGEWLRQRESLPPPPRMKSAVKYFEILGNHLSYKSLVHINFP